jgi:hypothetical protein
MLLSLQVRVAQSPRCADAVRVIGTLDGALRSADGKLLAELAKPVGKLLRNPLMARRDQLERLHADLERQLERTGKKASNAEKIQAVVDAGSIAVLMLYNFLPLDVAHAPAISEADVTARLKTMLAASDDAETVIRKAAMALGVPRKRTHDWFSYRDKAMKRVK